MSWRTYLLAYLFALLVLVAFAGTRAMQRSPHPHFGLQAAAWLDGRLDITAPVGDDWAQVETVALADGRHVRGRRRLTNPTLFETTQGEFIRVSDITQTLATKQYVSFPSAPAVLMLPLVGLWGPAANDAALTLALAALALPLMLGLLGALRRHGLRQVPTVDDWWLALAFTFGTVYFFVAVAMGVWFMAHVVGVVACLIYARASLAGAHPWRAGLAFAIAATTRTPMAFMLPWFALEVIRGNGGWQGVRVTLTRAWPQLWRFAVPVLAIGGLAAWHNAARFDHPLEFGHRFLHVRQQLQMELHGLFAWRYVPRNLVVALALLPQLSNHAPFVRISGHGLAVWLTTPAYAWLARLRTQGPDAGRARLALWLTVACIALPSIAYQNTGWFQFGYRFSLDYQVFLFMLLALRPAPLGRGLRAAIVVGIAINALGAATFQRTWSMYRVDAHAYEHVGTP